MQRAWRRFVRRREAAAAVIKRKWREVISDPSHPACKRRIAREFAEMQGDAV